MALQSGMLYTTSEKQVGFIAFRRPGEKAGLRVGLCFVKPTLGAMRLRDRIRFAKVMAKGGEGFNRKTDRKKSRIFSPARTATAAIIKNKRNAAF